MRLSNGELLNVNHRIARFSLCSYARIHPYMQKSTKYKSHFLLFVIIRVVAMVRMDEFCNVKITGLGYLSFSTDKDGSRSKRSREGGSGR
jgi:hypothetical protein